MGADGPFPDWEPAAERQDRAADQRDDDAAARNELPRPDHQADPLLQRSRRLVEGVRGAAHQASQTSAALVRRFIEAKQRELAAHRAIALVYEQLAELEERFGRLARAAEAWTQAAHAREHYELAEGELAAYQVRITAIRVKRATHRRNGNGRPVG
jgi:hypothetical protein